MLFNKNKFSLIRINKKPLICLILGIAITSLYWQVNDYPFVSLDDGLYVYKNSMVKSGLNAEGIKWAFGFSDIAYWHPLTWISHMVAYHFFELDAGAHHMINVVIHLFNVILLFFIFNKMTGDIWCSTLLAAFFGMHPINVESVAWIAERKNVLSTFFFLLTIMMYTIFIDKGSVKWYILSLITFGLGLLSKSAIAPLPFVLLLIDYWPLKRYRLRYGTYGSNINNTGFLKTIKKYINENKTTFKLILEKIPFLVLSATAVWLSIVSIKKSGVYIPTEIKPLGLRIANALTSYVNYIFKILLPKNLCVFYPYPDHILISQAIGASLILLIISIITILYLKKKPYLSVGWFWYVGTLFPSIGVLQAGLWPALADRWAYIPCMGLFVILIWGGRDMLESAKIKSKYAISMSVALIIFMTSFSWKQISYWSNNINLYSRAIEVTKENVMAHSNLGAELYLKGRKNKAIFHFIEAMRINPEDKHAHINLQSALNYRNDIDGSKEKVEKLIRVYPENPGLYYNLGVILLQKGNIEQAMENYKKAIFYFHDFPQAQFDLAYTYALKGEYEMAIYRFKKTIEINPSLVWAYYHIAAILSIQNKVDESIYWLEQSIKRGFVNWDFLSKDKRLENIRRTFFLKKLKRNYEK